MGFSVAFQVYLTANVVIATAINVAINGPVTLALLYPEPEEAKLWVWPKPIAGDVFISLLLGFSITWAIASQLAMQDTLGDSCLKIVNAPTLETIGPFWRRIATKQVPLFPPEYMKKQENAPSEKLQDRLVQVLALSFGIGLSLALLFTPLFILVGEFVIKDDWNEQNLLIFKCLWGVPVGIFAQGGACYSATAFGASHAVAAPRINDAGVTPSSSV